jgi:hypothetical protein
MPRASSAADAQAITPPSSQPSTTRRQSIRSCLTFKHGCAIKRGWIACHDRTHDRFAKRPKTVFCPDIGSAPTPPPTAALVLPEFQALTAQFVEDQANMPNEGVADLTVTHIFGRVKNQVYVCNIG